MGATKYPILDPDLKLKMLGAALTEEDRGLIATLWLTGMHPCIISKDKDQDGNERPRPEIVKEGPMTYIYWKRAKTGKRLREPVPKELQPSIEAFLKAPKKSVRYNYERIKAIGLRAGYEGVSASTLRHSRCLRGLTVEGYTIYEMAHKMGCTLDVVVRNYAALKDTQMQGSPSIAMAEPLTGTEDLTAPPPRTRPERRKRSSFDRLRHMS